VTIADLFRVGCFFPFPDQWIRKMHDHTIGACVKADTDRRFTPFEERISMSEKVALPSLSLPKQKTHWTVSVVIVAGVLLLILGAALYAVLQRQQAAEEAFAKAAADRAALVQAEIEKTKAETARAIAEAKKKEAETAAAIQAASQQKKAAQPVTDEEGQKKTAPVKKKGSHHGGAKVASKGASAPAAAAAAPAPAKPAPSSKASKDIDDLLRGLK
jgi:cytoskeletal protein RodZ